MEGGIPHVRAQGGQVLNLSCHLPTAPRHPAGGRDERSNKSGRSPEGVAPPRGPSHRAGRLVSLGHQDRDWGQN